MKSALSKARTVNRRRRRSRITSWYVC